jgi:hypothetical protein
MAWAAHHGLDWGPDIIHGLVLATRGYPTGMWEGARAAMKGGSGLGQMDSQNHKGAHRHACGGMVESGEAEDLAMNPCNERTIPDSIS